MLKNPSNGVYSGASVSLPWWAGDLFGGVRPQLQFKHGSAVEGGTGVVVVALLLVLTGSGLVVEVVVLEVVEFSDVEF